MKTKTLGKWQLVIGIIAMIYGVLAADLFNWGLFGLTSTRSTGLTLAILGLGFILTAIPNLKSKK